MLDCATVFGGWAETSGKSRIEGGWPGAGLGIDCHSDTENVVANSLAALRAGVHGD
ncbi:MAG: hypothetical protein IIA01_04355 [Proteobacteria bacterium]|nr:hypothetical protein [Pseudomonadota bacterium]